MARQISEKQAIVEVYRNTGDLERNLNCSLFRKFWCKIEIHDLPKVRVAQVMRDTKPHHSAGCCQYCTSWKTLVLTCAYISDKEEVHSKQNTMLYPTGSCLRISILNRYNSYNYNAKKQIILSTRSPLRLGRNLFLGVLYVVIAGCLLLSAVGVLLGAAFSNRHVGHISQLSWNRVESWSCSGCLAMTATALDADDPNLWNLSPMIMLISDMTHVENLSVWERLTSTQIAQTTSFKRDSILAFLGLFRFKLRAIFLHKCVHEADWGSALQNSDLNAFFLQMYNIAQYFLSILMTWKILQTMCLDMYLKVCVAWIYILVHVQQQWWEGSLMQALSQVMWPKVKINLCKIYLCKK